MRLKTFSVGIMRSLFVGCLSTLLSVGAWAQSSQTIKGTVLDANTREPMIGVSVLEKGTSNGVITDLDGNFVINGVKSGATVTFSFVGFTTRELPASKTTRH